MLKPLLKSIRQGLTALVLLMVLLIGVEGVMQWNAQNSQRLVCDNVCSTQQALLIPSPTVHHDNPRVEQVTIEDVLYRFDASGFRLCASSAANNSTATGGDDSRRIPTTKKSGSAPLKIAVLGDERVFGMGLSEEDCLTSRLEWFLNSDPQASVEVINAGVPGYCPLLSLLKYRQDLMIQRPDIVILHIDYSDIADDVVYRRYLKKHADSGAVCTHPDLKNAARQKNRLIEVANQSQLARLLKIELNRGTQPFDQNGISEQYSWTLQPGVSDSLSTRIEHALRPVAELAREVEGQGGVFLLSCSPLPWQLGTESGFAHFRSQIPKSAWNASPDAISILESMAQRLSVPFCNPTSQFAAFSQPQRLYLDQSLDLSRFGALLYARELAGFLLKQQAYQTRKSGRSTLASGGSGVL